MSHFNIQRSLNSSILKTIGKTLAKNKSVNEYRFIDELKNKDQYTKALYCRIQSIDKDAKIIITN